MKLSNKHLNYILFVMIFFILLNILIIHGLRMFNKSISNDDGFLTSLKPFKFKRNSVFRSFKQKNERETTKPTLSIRNISVNSRESKECCGACMCECVHKLLLKTTTSTGEQKIIFTSIIVCRSRALLFFM